MIRGGAGHIGKHQPEVVTFLPETAELPKRTAAEPWDAGQRGYVFGSGESTPRRVILLVRLLTLGALVFEREWFI